jgi:hypothetical protein
VRGAVVRKITRDLNEGVREAGAAGIRRRRNVEDPAIHCIGALRAMN